MPRERREKQQQMDLTMLEQLAPENHLLRRIGAAVDFSFVHNLRAQYCADNERATINLDVVFRMLGIQNMREQAFLTATVQNVKRILFS